MRIARRISIGLVVIIVGAAVAAGIQLHRSGYRAYIIHTGSMIGSYDPGDLVFDHPVTSPVQVGQVITFQHSGLSSDLVTHRVVRVKDGVIRTKGDANHIADTWKIRPDQVKGVVAASAPKLGYLVYFLKQRSGDAAVVTALFSFLLLWGLFFTDESRPAIASPTARETLTGPGAIDRLRRARCTDTLEPDRIAALRTGRGGHSTA